MKPTTADLVYSVLPATRAQIIALTGLNYSQVNGVLQRGMRFGRLTRDGTKGSAYRLAETREDAA